MAGKSFNGRVIIGPIEPVDFPTLKIFNIPARVDTGARTNSLWASDIKVSGDKILFKLFGEGSDYYTGETIELSNLGKIVVTSSIGQSETRYKVEVPIRLGGRRIRARFTLSNRSTQIYPILIGRNTLRGKFIVDVKGDILLKSSKKNRSTESSNQISSLGDN